MIHHANHIRPNRDGVKVGGHQASSASLATLMTALYLDVLRPQDRIAEWPKRGQSTNLDRFTSDPDAWPDWV
jgi:pyruvate dehydrogenase E1 component